MNLANKPVVGVVGTFPVADDVEAEGMTYREWLAGLAMRGFLASGKFADIPDIPKTVARWSVSHADSLIAELEKKS
jgi:hypothetical protein